MWGRTHHGQPPGHFSASIRSAALPSSRTEHGKDGARWDAGRRAGRDQWYDTAKTGGRFERSASAFRNWVTADGRPGPSGEGGFKGEAGRYHLTVSLACPWAHRTLIVRALKGLETRSRSRSSRPTCARRAGCFPESEGGVPGATADALFGSKRVYELYQRAKPDYSGRVTVPVLWDRERDTIVSNESAEIIRMLNDAFGGEGPDLYPEELREDIDAVNARVYDRVNNGVYKAGFATKQEAYEEAFTALFTELDALEDRLDRQRYLCGSRSRKPTSACSRRWCGSTRSMSATSSATAAGSATTPICPIISATSMPCRAWPRR